MIFLYIILGIIGIELLFVLFTILCSLFVRKDEYTKDNKFYRFFLTAIPVQQSFLLCRKEHLLM